MHIPLVAVTKKANRLMLIVSSLLKYSWRFGRWGYKTTMYRPDLLSNTKGIQLGENVVIRKGARLETVGSLDGKKPKLIIGDGTSIHLYFHCAAAESVVIGRDVLIAGRVYISDHDHVFDHLMIPPIRSGLRTAPVVIEDEVWIGEGAAILKGVRVGKRAVIGTNAVVTHDIPAFSVAAGIPARVIRSFKPDPENDIPSKRS